MKKLLLLAAALLLSSCAAHAEQIRLRTNYPTTGCGSPAPAGVSGFKLHFAWSGPISGEDSVSVSALGDVVNYTIIAALGAYMIRSWPSWVSPPQLPRPGVTLPGQWIASCQQDTITYVLYPAPARVVIGTP